MRKSWREKYCRNQADLSFTNFDGDVCVIVTDHISVSPSDYGHVQVSL